MAKTLSRLARRPLPWLILASFLFLYLHLFVPFFTPIWTGGDQVVFLHDASRMVDGQVLYRDFAQMTFPGTDLLYFAAFKIFGQRMWIPNGLLLILGVSLVCLSYFIAERVNLGKMAVLPPLLFLTLVYRDRLDATHHWFSVLATLGALAVLIERRTRIRLALAGALCGIGTCFTQSLGFMVLVAFGLFVYREARKSSTAKRALIEKQLLLIASFSVTVFVGVGYVIREAGLQDFLYNTLVFSVRYYPTFPGANNWQGYAVGLPGFLHWQKIPDLVGFLLVHALLPSVYVLFSVRCFRDSTKQTDQPWDRLMLVNLVGVFSLLSVATAPTWARLYYVSLPALVLFTWIIKSEKRASYVFSTLLGFTAVLLIAFPLAKQLHRPVFLDLPTGRTAFLNRDAYERYRWAASQMQPQDFFFGGLFPDFYFTLELRNPGPVPFITPYEYTRPKEVEEILRSLQQRHVKLLLWTPALDLPATPQGDHLRPLRLYILNHYHVSSRFPAYDVWTRND